MPTLTALGNDGIVTNQDFSGGRGFWAGARDAATGTGASSTITRDSKSCIIQTGTPNFANIIMSRSFFVFDCSGISSAVASATLKIYGHNTSSGQVIAIKASAPNSNGSTALSVADWDALPGFSAGASMNGNVTDYASAITSGWSTSGYNDFTLNSDALSDLENNSVIQIAIVNYNFDYLNNAPSPSGVTVANGMYFSDYVGTSTDPIIDYTLATSAGIAKLNDVAVANIGDFNDIAKANIAKINDIDMT